MSYILEKEIWSHIFAVPCDLVDKHIRLCGETSLKVLLILLRCGGDASPQDLAGMLGKSEQDIRDAILYWEQAGVLSRRTGFPEPVSDAAPVSFHAALPLKQDPVPVAVPPPPAAPPLPDPEEQRKIQTLSKSRTRLSSQEIGQMAREDESIAYLLQEAQAVIGKPLTPVATDTIVALYSYYGMQPDLVLMLLQYCVAMGRDSMRYVEKVAATWLEKGVDSHEKAEEEILRATEMASVEHKIKSAFGIYDRKLVASEQKYIRTWTQEYRFDIDIISLAFERAVEQKGQLSFPYINGILANWYAAGIRTAGEAAQEIRQRQQKPSGVTGAGRGQSTGAPSGGASYDISELERMILYKNTQQGG